MKGVAAAFHEAKTMKNPTAMIAACQEVARLQRYCSQQVGKDQDDVAEARSYAAMTDAELQEVLAGGASPVDYHEDAYNVLWAAVKVVGRGKLFDGSKRQIGSLV